MGLLVKHNHLSINNFEVKIKLFYGRKDTQLTYIDNKEVEQVLSTFDFRCILWTFQVCTYGRRMRSNSAQTSKKITFRCKMSAVTKKMNCPTAFMILCFNLYNVSPFLSIFFTFKFFFISAS